MYKKNRGFRLAAFRTWTGNREKGSAVLFYQSDGIAINNKRGREETLMHAGHSETRDQFVFWLTRADHVLEPLVRNGGRTFVMVRDSECGEQYVPKRLEVLVAKPLRRERAAHLSRLRRAIATWVNLCEMDLPAMPETWTEFV
jgi:hypothetical protein